MPAVEAEPISPSDRSRFSRHILLREVGISGQARVLGATAHVDGDSFANRVAARYARRAGFARVAPCTVDRETLAPPGVVVHDAARDVLAGSRAALAAFRRAAVEGATDDELGEPETE